jgi:hypothetical protein
LEAKLNGPYDFFNNRSIGVSGYGQLKVVKRQFLFFSQNYQENKIEKYLKRKISLCLGELPSFEGPYPLPDFFSF